LHVRQHRYGHRAALDAPVRGRGHPPAARAEPGFLGPRVGAVLKITHDRGIIYLTVPRPVRLGAGSDDLAWQIADACRRIGESDERPAAVALVGSGEAFCALPPRSAADCDAAGAAWRDATVAVPGLAPPSLASMGGDAIGPAFELALACDLRIAASEIRLGCP